MHLLFCHWGRSFLNFFGKYRDWALHCFWIGFAQNLILNEQEWIQGFFGVVEVEHIIATKAIEKCFWWSCRPDVNLGISNNVKSIFDVKNEWLSLFSFFQHGTKTSRILQLKYSLLVRMLSNEKYQDSIWINH